MAVQKPKNPVVATLSGAIAGGIEATCVWPLETIKTNLQLGTMKQHYTGMLSGFRYHVSEAGVLSLYRGLAPVLIGSIPKAGIRFGGYEAIKSRMVDGNEPATVWINLAAGMSAGAMEAVVAVTPIETIKTRLIDSNSGVISGTRKILATEGLRGLYKGVTATIMKQASNQGLRFMWFSEYKKNIPSVLDRYFGVDYDTLDDGPLALVSLIGGMSAGCFSTLGNNPFDVVKTRMQGLQASQYKGTLDCVAQILKKEGFLAFYSGVVPRLGRVVPGQGIIFMSYDSISRFVSVWIEKDNQ